MASLVFNPFTGTFDFVEKAKDKLRLGVPLQGTVNGTNTAFTTPEKFIFTPGVTEIAVYLNGVRQTYGVGADFTVAESGGSGAGYDTIILAVAPVTIGVDAESLLADYVLP